MNMSPSVWKSHSIKWLTLISFVLITAGFGFAQDVLFSEDFNYANGTTSGPGWEVLSVNDCDDTGYIFEVQGNSFLVNDAEGFNCCNCVGAMSMEECGDNGNVISFGPFDIQGLCFIEISLDVNPIGDLECDNFETEPTCDGGTDQVILSLNIDGSVSNVVICCGISCPVFTIPLNLNGQSSLNFQIIAGTQAADESYEIDDILVTGLIGPEITNLTPNSDILCQGDDLEIQSEVVNCANCQYTWEDEDLNIVGTDETLLISNIQADADEVEIYSLTVSNGECEFIGFVGVAVLMSYPDIPLEMPFCTDDVNQINLAEFYFFAFQVTGALSGPGVQQDQMNFSSFGLDPGDYTLIFTPNDNCGDSEITLEVIDTLPYNLDPLGPFETFDPVFSLDIAPDGISGSWSGSGVSFNMFDPAAAGVGFHNLQFRPDDFGCTTDIKQILVEVVQGVYTYEIDTSLIRCNGGSEIFLNVFDFFESPYILTDFIDVESSGADISDLEFIDFTGVAVDTYDFKIALYETLQDETDTVYVGVFVDSLPNAGENSIVQICFGLETQFNLLDHLDGNPDPGGMWIKDTSEDVDISDPDDVDMSMLPSGRAYDFRYIVEGENCMNSKVLTIVVQAPPDPGLGLTLESCISEELIFDLDGIIGPHSNGMWQDLDNSGVDLSDPSNVDLNSLQAGSFTFQHYVTSTNSCPDDSTQIDIIILGRNDAGDDHLDNAVCAGTQIVLADFMNGDDGGFYEDGNFEPVGDTVDFADGVDTVATYYYIVGDGIICPYDTATIQFDVQVAPEGEFSAIAMEMCTNGCQNITLTIDGEGPFTLDLALDSDIADTLYIPLVSNNEDLTIVICGDPVQTAFQNDSLFINYTESVNWTLFHSGIANAVCAEPDSELYNPVSISLFEELSAGADSLGNEVCIGASVDLTNFVTGDLGGGFFDSDFLPAGFTQNFMESDAGSQIFYYIVDGGAACPADTAIFEFIVSGSPLGMFMPTQVGFCANTCREVQFMIAGDGPYTWDFILQSDVSAPVLFPQSTDEDTLSIMICGNYPEAGISGDTIKIPSGLSENWVLSYSPISNEICDGGDAGPADSLRITLRPINNAGADSLEIMQCFGDMINLMDYVTGEPGGRFFDNNTVQVDPMIVLDQIPSGNVVYSYVVGDGLGCSNDMAFLQFQITPIPTSDFGGNVEICLNKCEDIQMNITGQGPFNMDFVLDFGGATQVVVPYTVDQNNNTLTICHVPNGFGIQDDTLRINSQVTNTWTVFHRGIGNGICPANPDSISNPLNITLDQAVELADKSPTLCPGDSMVYAGVVYNEANPFGTVVLPGPICDTTFFLILDFFDEAVLNYEGMICEGDMLVLGGEIFNSARLEDQIILIGQSDFGCDSTINVSLTLVENLEINMDTMICEGDSLFVEGAYQFTDGIYFDSLNTSSGCDSVLITNLQVIPLPNPGFTTDTVEICRADAGSVDLFAYLEGDPDPDGMWTDDMGLGFDLSDPTSVNLDLGASSFDLTYSVSNLICEEVTTVNWLIRDPAEAGTSGDIGFCPIDAVVVNLEDLLGTHDPGTWSDVDGSGADLSDPANVMLVSLPFGSYRFRHIVTSQYGVCPSDTVEITVEIAELPSLLSQEVMCSVDLLSYDLRITVETDIEVMSSLGSIAEEMPGQYLISDIPVDSALGLVLTDLITICASELILDSPECTCPFVNMPRPLNTSDTTSFCEAEAIPPLEVEIDFNQLANWYDDPLAGNLITGGSTVFNPPSPGNYYVEAVDTTNGCLSSGRLELIVIENPVSSENVDMEICEGDSLFVGGTWQKAEGTYRDTLVSGLNCDSIVVTQLTLMSCIQLIESSFDEVLCTGDSTGAIHFVLFGYDFPIDYTWNQEDGTMSGSGTITAEGDTTTVGNLPRGAYFVNFDVPDQSNLAFDLLGISNLTGELVILTGAACDDNPTGALMVIGADGVEPYEYQWSTGEDGPVVEDLPVGEYGVTITDAQMCTIEFTSLIEEIQGPLIGVETTDAFCPEAQNGTITVNIEEGLNPPYQYSLDGISYGDSMVFTDLDNGNYTLYILDGSLCVFEYSGNVVGYTSEIDIAIPERYILNTGDSALLQPQFNFEPAEITWTPSLGLSCDQCPNPFASPGEDTEYLLTAIDQFGCSVSKLITIEYNFTAGVYLPNVMQLNSDTGNGLFFPRSRADLFGIVDMRIFDRWGNKVFENESIPINTEAAGWDGLYNAKFVDPGVFVYYVHITWENGSETKLVGDLTVVR